MSAEINITGWELSGHGGAGRPATDLTEWGTVTLNGHTLLLLDISLHRYRDRGSSVS